MIEREGKIQVEIIGAGWEVVETKDHGDMDIAKVYFKDANGNEDELSMWLSDAEEKYGKYAGKPQFEANLERLINAGMKDGDPANIEEIIGTHITVFGKEKTTDGGATYFQFYWQDSSTKPADPSDVQARIERLRGKRAELGGTPLEDDDSQDQREDDDDETNLPF